MKNECVIFLEGCRVLSGRDEHESNVLEPVQLPPGPELGGRGHGDGLLISVKRHCGESAFSGVRPLRHFDSFRRL